MCLHLNRKTELVVPKENSQLMNPNTVQLQKQTQLNYSSKDKSKTSQYNSFILSTKMKRPPHTHTPFSGRIHPHRTRIYIIATPPTPRQMSSEEFKAQGNKFFAEKNFAQAAESFTKAIEASPAPNHVLYSNRSACFASLKDFPQALQDAEECVKINPSWAKGYNRVASAEYGLGKFEEAKTQYEKALSIDPSNAMAKEGLKAVQEATENGPDMGLGRIFSDPNMIEKLKSNPKTAEMMKDPELVQKVERMRSNPQAMAGEFMSDQRLMTIMAALLGVDLSMGGQDAGSQATGSQPAGGQATESQDTGSQDTEMKDAPKAETKKPEPEPTRTEEQVPKTEVSNSKQEADAIKQEANKLYKEKKFDEAIELYNKAWNTFKDITYLNNRAAAEFEKGDYEITLATCELAVEEGRNMRADYKIVAKSFARMGNTYLKQDNLPKAIEVFEKSLTEHRTADVLAKVKAAKKELKKREVESYIDPEKAEEARLLGKEYFTKGDWPNAVKAYGEMVNRAPEDPRGYSNRAAALAKLMAFPDAVEDCNKAISKDPNFIRAYIRKANAQLLMKDFTKCLDTLTTARSVDMKANGSKSMSEIDSLYHKAMSQRFESIDGETPEQTMERVSRDPEVSAILQDPIMQSILEQARSNPAALRDHMKNPDIYKKINTLMAAGIIR